VAQVVGAARAKGAGLGPDTLMAVEADGMATVACLKIRPSAGDAEGVDVRAEDATSSGGMGTRARGRRGRPQISGTRSLLDRWADP